MCKEGVGGPIAMYLQCKRQRSKTCCWGLCAGGRGGLRMPAAPCRPDDLISWQASMVLAPVALDTPSLID